MLVVSGLHAGTGELDVVLFLREGDVVGVGSCVVSRRITSIVCAKVFGLKGKELSARRRSEDGSKPSQTLPCLMGIMFPCRRLKLF